MIVHVKCLVGDRKLEYDLDAGTYKVLEKGKRVHDSAKDNPEGHPKPHHLHTMSSLWKIEWGFVESVFVDYTFPKAIE